MKGWLLLVAAFLLWPGCSSQDACEEPEDVDFGEIVSTERAKYLENDQVQYKCNLGYVLEGPEWIQCKGQKWTPRPPKCLAPCSITRQQLATKNLFVFGSQRKARLVQSNQSLQFLCDEGYVLVVPSVRKCVDGYIELPLCISGGGKNCSGPPRIENGDIMTLSAKQYRSGSSVEFRCQSHYAMEGQKRSFCDNGAWTKAPICLDPCVIPRTELESQKITEVENGTEVKNGTDVPENIFVQRGLSIELTCRTGYVLAENSSQSAFEMHCDGTPPVIPKCKEITCNSPRIPDGSFRPQRTVYHDGDLIRIRCDSGFTFQPVNGEQVVECTKNGWSPSPKCFKIKCGADYIENGNVLFPKLTYKEGERIRFSCNEGYTYVDRQEASCTENGWSTLLQCKEIQCFPPVVANGRFEPRRTQHMYNDKIETICDEGFVPRDPKLSKCIASGWDPPPACIRKGCDFVRVENGRMQNYGKFPKREGEQVWFQCNDGFLPKIKHQTWQTVTCTNSRFEPEPKCFKKCDPSQRFYHGHFPYNNIYIEGDNITFVCDTGYSPANQQSTITCTKTGWSPPPKCIQPPVERTCNKLPLANGYFESEQRIFQINAKAIYSCHNGYTTSKGETEAETQCLSGGWSPEPECIKSCLKPPEGDFIFNTTKPVFFPGDELHYECKEGFQTTKNTINETVACTEKGWESTPSCNPITCNIPFLENGRIDPREDTFYHGMVVHFGCNEGFTRVGPESAQCYQFGWSPQPPICKENVVSCPVSPIISHGTIIGESKPTYQHGDLLEVQCDISFALYGSKIIECVDGEWAPLPSCIEESKTCRRPPTIRNGQLANAKSSPYRHGETVTYNCRKPSVLTGTNPATCLHGQWEVPSCLVNPQDCTRPQYADFQPTVQTTKRFQTNQFANYHCGSKVHQTNCVNGLWFPEPRCEGTCPPPPQLPNAINVAEMRIYRSEEEISFKCQEHFLLHGPQKIKCDDGKWQTPPRCLDLRCKPPPEIDNGIPVIENVTMFPPGEIVEYRCSLGFEISQLNTVKCENGKWSELPVCREKSCGPAPDIPNASLQQENRENREEYDSGTIINYTCNPGFEAKESAKKTCRRGEWVGAFTCKDIRCSSPPEIEHARIMGERKAKYLTEEKVKYQCNTGYVLLGNSFITCSKEGWTEIPRCTVTEGRCGRPPPVENGDVVDTPKLTYLHSESVTYQCQNFYTMQGSPRVTCQNGRWSQTPTCRVACTASEEDMIQRNIRLRWPRGHTLYSMDGNVVEFVCLRGYNLHPSSGPLRTNCVEGKFDYPYCIRYN